MEPSEAKRLRRLGRGPEAEAALGRRWRAPALKDLLSKKLVTPRGREAVAYTRGNYRDNGTARVQLRAGSIVPVAVSTQGDPNDPGCAKPCANDGSTGGSARRLMGSWVATAM